LLDLLFDPEDGRDMWYIPHKRRLAFTRLHGVISLKIEFIKFLWIR
jgi:hypothetical protein